MPYGKTVFEMLNEVYTGGPSRPPPAPGRVNGYRIMEHVQNGIQMR